MSRPSGSANADDDAGEGTSAETSELRGARWRKSSFSGPTGGNCVETAALAENRIAIRNSRFPAGPALVFTAGAWEAFIGRCVTMRAD
ncbi:MAG TPA: DUF397 domain-containing protein [Streptosporangiaceae bacterium]|jgi:hypothetical protein